MSSPLGLRRVETASRPHTIRWIPRLLLLTQLLAAPAGAADPDDADAADDGAAAAVARAFDPAAAHSVGTVTAIATRTERDVLDTAGNVTVIDREAIEESGARNVPSTQSARTKSPSGVSQRSRR